MRSQPNEALLQAYVERLSIPRDPFENPDNLNQTLLYIESLLSQWGYASQRHPFTYEGQSFENVSFSYSSNTHAQKLLIGAHADAVPGCPGADDNASGLAGLLEIARCLADQPAAKAVEFVVFNLEEYGMVGSRHWVRRYAKSNTSPAGMLSLEMIGYISEEEQSQKLPFFLKPFYPHKGNFIALVGDSSSNHLLSKATTAFNRVPQLNLQSLSVPFRGLVLPETRLSDHSPFWDAGIPALLVTDTSFFRNPYYHSPQDIPEKLNIPFMAKVVEGVLKLIEDFAENPKMPR